MSPTVEYHCLNCLDNSVTRDFDVSHLSVSCDSCGEFGRFVNGRVLAKVREFEDDPPDDLEWGHLDRMEQFLVAERIVRKGHTLEDFDIEVPDEEADTDDSDETDDATERDVTEDVTKRDVTEDATEGADAAPADVAVDEGDRP